MIHPSYVELMKVVNKGAEIGEEPVVNSRYSIVCATAKRARQLVSGAAPLEDEDRNSKKKPLSIAVNELASGDLKILTDEEANMSYSRLQELYNTSERAKKRHDEIVAEEDAKRLEAEEAEKRAKEEKKARKERMAAEAAAKAKAELEDDPVTAMMQIEAFDDSSEEYDIDE